MCKRSCFNRLHSRLFHMIHEIMCIHDACCSSGIFLCSLFCFHVPHQPRLFVVPSQCHAHHLPFTKIPTFISRAAASLDRPRPSSAEPRGSTELQKQIAKVGGWKSDRVPAQVLEISYMFSCKHEYYLLSFCNIACIRYLLFHIELKR